MVLAIVTLDNHISTSQTALYCAPAQNLHTLTDDETE
jgi:hypothetical protein